MIENFYDKFTCLNKFKVWLSEHSEHSTENYRLIFNTKRYLDYLSLLYNKYDPYLEILTQWCTVKNICTRQTEWNGKYVYMFISTNNGVKPCYVIYKNGVYMGLEREIGENEK